MVDFFDNLYSSVINKNKFLFKIKFYSFLRFSIRILANLIIPIYFLSTHKNNRYALKKTNRSTERIIVSLTTFPLRISKVWLVVESILRQSHQPDKIILWLSKEQFATLEMLPARLLKMQDRGLEVRLCEGDLRSHKKYYYSFKEYANDVIVTVDDDILYPTDMIESLMNSHKQNPLSVVCRYAFRMCYKNNKLMKYNSWSQLYNYVPPSYETFFGSGGGTLFPPNSLHCEVLNKNVFSTICFLADDIWLNAMVRLNNVNIVKVNCSNTLLPVINKNNTTLYSVNVGENQNDKQLQNVSAYCLVKYNTDPFLNRN